MQDLLSIHLSDQVIASFSESSSEENDNAYITLLDRSWQLMARKDWQELIESILKRGKAAQAQER